MINKIIGLVLVLGLCSVSYAGYEKKQAVQNKKIKSGVASGTITPVEEKRLDHGQKKVERKAVRYEKTKADAKKDGVITPAEKRKMARQKVNIENTQDRQSKAIQNKKNNLRKTN